MSAVLRFLLLGAAASCAGAGTALAHVVVTPTAIEAGRPAVIAFRVGHGCAGSPTRALRVELPEAVVSAKPQAKAGWTIAVDRAPPVGGVPGRVRAITWSGAVLPDDEFDDFPVQIAVTDAAAAVYLPAVQTCERGEARWTEQPAPGQNPHDLKRPAALLTGRPAAPLAVLKGLVVESGWVRAAPTGAPTAAAYLVIRNTGAVDDRLIGVRSPAAAKAELHTMSMTGGVMRMRPLPGGLKAPAGGDIRLEPGGDHVMLIGPTAPVVAGGTVTLTLQFRRAGALTVALPVRAAADDAGEHHHPEGGQ